MTRACGLAPLGGADMLRPPQKEEEVLAQFRHGVRVALAFGIGAALALSAGCSDDVQPTGTASNQLGSASPETMPTADSPRPDVVPQSQEQLIAEGRSVYNGNCIACHGMNPSQDGALGPAVAGATLPLLEERVMRSGYPEGYVPKRTSRVMIPLPHLEPKLPALAAYLGSLE